MRISKRRGSFPYAHCGFRFTIRPRPDDFCEPPITDPYDGWWCAMKTVQEMEAGPPKPACRSRLRKTIRQWRLHRMVWTSLEDIAEKINPVIRGWYQYYGRFYKTALFSVLRNVERSLKLWARWKYKGLRNHQRNARRFLGRVYKRTPGLFVHWKLGLGSKAE